MASGSKGILHFIRLKGSASWIIKAVLRDYQLYSTLKLQEQSRLQEREARVSRYDSLFRYQNVGRESDADKISVTDQQTR